MKCTVEITRSEAEEPYSVTHNLFMYGVTLRFTQELTKLSLDPDRTSFVFIVTKEVPKKKNVRKRHTYLDD